MKIFPLECFNEYGMHGAIENLLALAVVGYSYYSYKVAIQSE